MSANAFASKQKILLVEDEAFLSHEIAEALQYENYLVLTAEDGRQGLEIARREMPDLIISDIMMPNLDGYGFLMALREDTVTARIPFIFLTAKSEYADMRKGMAFGADDYLVKPFDILELLTLSVPAFKNAMKRLRPLPKKWRPCGTQLSQRCRMNSARR